MRLVTEAENSRAPFVRLADRYAMWFLPLTLTVAGAAWALGGPARAVAVLVVATPCPLILAAPVALVSGLSAAARRGAVVKSGGVLERLAQCTTLVLDKTGTLTVGQPELVAITPAGPGGPAADEILTLAASLDQVSGHVLAATIARAAAERGCPLTEPADVCEVPGQGIAGRVGGREVRLGRAGWTGAAESEQWVRTARRRAGLVGALTVFAAVDGRRRACYCSRTRSARTQGRRSARCAGAASTGLSSPRAPDKVVSAVQVVFSGAWRAAAAGWSRFGTG